MGLYDEIISDYPLSEWPGRRGAAVSDKGPRCLLQTYRITSDGRLLVSSDEHTPAGKLQRSGMRDTQHHGYLVFYTSVEHAGRGEWFEYQAKFTDGRLVDMRRLARTAVART
jgi:hypothetical protein